MKNYLFILSLAGVALAQPGARAEEMSKDMKVAGGTVLEAGAVAALYKGHIIGKAAREANEQARDQANALAEATQKHFIPDEQIMAKNRQYYSYLTELEENEKKLQRAKEGYFIDRRVAKVTSEKFAPGGDKLSASFFIYQEPVFVPPQGATVTGPVMVNVDTVEVLEKYGPSRSVSKKVLSRGLTSIAATIKPVPAEQWIDIAATEAKVAELKKIINSPAMIEASRAGGEVLGRKNLANYALSEGHVNRAQGKLSPDDIKKLEKAIADMKMIQEGGAKRLATEVNYSVRLKLLGAGLGIAGAALQYKALTSGESDVQAAEAGAASAR